MKLSSSFAFFLAAATGVLGAAMPGAELFARANPDLQCTVKDTYPAVKDSTPKGRPVTKDDYEQKPVPQQCKGIADDKMCLELVDCNGKSLVYKDWKDCKAEDVSIRCWCSALKGACKREPKAPKPGLKVGSAIMEAPN